LVIDDTGDVGLGTADQKLCRVATLEAFAVTNPEQPASIVI
jgi:hypothetical protein